MNTKQRDFFIDIKQIFEKYSYSGGFSDRALNKNRFESYFIFSAVHMRRYQEEVISDIKNILKKYGSILEDLECKYPDNDLCKHDFKILTCDKHEIIIDRRKDFTGIEYCIKANMKKEDFMSFLEAANTDKEKEELNSMLEVKINKSTGRARL